MRSITARSPCFIRVVEEGCTRVAGIMHADTHHQRGNAVASCSRVSPGGCCAPVARLHPRPCTARLVISQALPACLARLLSMLVSQTHSPAQGQVQGRRSTRHACVVCKRSRSRTHALARISSSATTITVSSSPDRVQCPTPCASGAITRMESHPILAEARPKIAPSSRCIRHSHQLPKRVIIVSSPQNALPPNNRRKRPSRVHAHQCRRRSRTTRNRPNNTPTSRARYRHESG